MESDERGTWQLRCHFISYRWESDAHNAWVRAFADGLRARGYPAILDQELMEAPDAPESRVEQLLHVLPRLADATHFTPILTDGYRERLIQEDDSEWKDGWVYDEWAIALSKAQAGELIFDGVWRGGADVPPPFTTENVADFRGDDLAGDLDRWYPRFEVDVVGARADGTRRVVGPVLYTEYPSVIQRLESEGDRFENFAIVPRAAT